MIRKNVQQTISLVLAWVREDVPNYGVGRAEDVFEGAGDARIEDWEALCGERDQLLDRIGLLRSTEVERDAAVNRAEQLEESGKIALESLQAQLDAAVKRAEQAEAKVTALEIQKQDREEPGCHLCGRDGDEAPCVEHLCAECAKLLRVADFRAERKRAHEARAMLVVRNDLVEMRDQELDDARAERERWLADPVIAGRVEVMRLADERDRTEAATDRANLDDAAKSPDYTLLRTMIDELRELRANEAAAQHIAASDRAVIDEALRCEAASAPIARGALACAALRYLRDRDGAVRAK